MNHHLSYPNGFKHFTVHTHYLFVIRQTLVILITCLRLMFFNFAFVIVSNSTRILAIFLQTEFTTESFRIICEITEDPCLRFLTRIAHQMSLRAAISTLRAQNALHVLRTSWRLIKLKPPQTVQAVLVADKATRIIRRTDLILKHYHIPFPEVIHKQQSEIETKLKRTITWTY